MSRGKLPNKTYVFIDVANLIYGAKRTGKWKVNYKKLYRYFRERYSASRIFFYAGVKSLTDNLFLSLKKIGYVLRLKTLRIYYKKPLIKKVNCPNCKKTFYLKIERKPERKANCDVDLTFDVMRYLSDYNKIILLSGDGDFYPLLNFLLQNKREVKVIGESSSTAISIKKLVKDKFIDLISIKNLISSHLGSPTR